MSLNLVRVIVCSPEQAVDPQCAQANSASYPQRDGRRDMSSIAYVLRPSVTEVVVGYITLSGCTAGPTVRYRGQWMAA